MSKKASKKGHTKVPLDETMQDCLSVLKYFQDQEEAEAFLEPVDWEAYGLVDYPEIIKEPMDLGTIQTKLESGKYSGSEAFARDVRLVWKNAMEYNRPDSDIYRTAKNLAAAFEKKLVSKLKKKAPGGSGGSGAPAGGTAPPTPSAAIPKTKTPATSPAASALAKGAPGPKKSAPGTTSGSSKAERVKFSQMVNLLTSEELGMLVDRIQKESPAALSEEEEDEVEIEINNIDANTLTALIAFANKCVQEREKLNGGGGVKAPLSTPPTTGGASDDEREDKKRKLD